MSVLDGAESGLSQKMGPLKAWQYGALAAAVIILVSLMKKKRAGIPTATPPADPATGYVEQSVDTSSTDPGNGQSSAFTGPIDSFLQSNPLHSAYPVGLNRQGLPGPVTNGQWAQLASDYLVSLGAVPVDVSAAFRSYFSGGSLTDSQRAIVNQGQRYFGAPPEGVSSVGPSPTPPTVQGYVRQAGAATVWQALSDNTLRGVTAPEYASLGQPSFTDIAASDPIWKRSVVGGVGQGPPGQGPDVNPFYKAGAPLSTSDQWLGITSAHPADNLVHATGTL